MLQRLSENIFYSDLLAFGLLEEQLQIFAFFLLVGAVNVTQVFALFLVLSQAAARIGQSNEQGVG